MSVKLPPPSVAEFDKMVEVLEEIKSAKRIYERRRGDLAFRDGREPESVKDLVAKHSKSIETALRECRIFDLSDLPSPPFPSHPEKQYEKMHENLAHIPFNTLFLNILVDYHETSDCRIMPVVMRVVGEDLFLSWLVEMTDDLWEATHKDVTRPMFAQGTEQERRGVSADGTYATIYPEYLATLKAAARKLTFNKAVHLVRVLPHKIELGTVFTFPNGEVSALNEEVGDDTPAVKSFAALFSRVLSYLDILADPKNFSVRGDPTSKFVPKNKSGAMKAKRRIPRSAERPIYKIMTAREARASLGLSAGEGAKKAAHERRGHYARLTHERYARNEDGSIKVIWRKSTWVGKSDAVIDKRPYKVILNNEDGAYTRKIDSIVPTAPPSMLPLITPDVGVSNPEKKISLWGKVKKKLGLS